MKALLSALIAITVIAGVAAAAAQAEPLGTRNYWVDRDANSN